MKCPRCSEENKTGSIFCIFCGGRLTEEEKDVLTLTPTTEAPVERSSLKSVPGVKIVTPTRAFPQSSSPAGITRVASPGMCFYHKELPASYVCNRCGRSICRDCVKVYSDLFFCPQCYMGSVPLY